MLTLGDVFSDTDPRNPGAQALATAACAVQLSQLVTQLERIADALEEIAAGGGYARTVSRKEEEPESLPPFPLARIQERSTDVQVMVTERVVLIYEDQRGQEARAVLKPGQWYYCLKDTVLHADGFAPLDIAAELRKQRVEAP